MPSLESLNRNVQVAGARADFLDLLGGHLRCLGHGRPFDAMPEFIKSPSPRLREVLQTKSIVPAATTSNSGWASASSNHEKGMLAANRENFNTRWGGVPKEFLELRYDRAAVHAELRGEKYIYRNLKVPL